MIRFTGENVPIEVVAKIMKKDANFVRQGIVSGNLPIGFAAKKKENNERMSYYVSPLKLYEYTGYVYEPAVVSI